MKIKKQNINATITSRQKSYTQNSIKMPAYYKTSSFGHCAGCILSLTTSETFVIHLMIV
jgi:hypothetical protein